MIEIVFEILLFLSKNFILLLSAWAWWQIARGAKWIQTVGEHGMVSVGSGDQVRGMEAEG